MPFHASVATAASALTPTTADPNLTGAACAASPYAREAIAPGAHQLRHSSTP